MRIWFPRIFVLRRMFHKIVKNSGLLYTTIDVGYWCHQISTLLLGLIFTSSGLDFMFEYFSPLVVILIATKVRTASGVRTWEECSALCSEEIACAYWSHHLYRSDCTIWSSDVTRFVLYLYGPAQPWMSKPTDKGFFLHFILSFRTRFFRSENEYSKDWVSGKRCK